MATKRFYSIFNLIAFVLLIFIGACNPQKESISPNQKENEGEEIQQQGESDKKENDRDGDEENDKNDQNEKDEKD